MNTPNRAIRHPIVKDKKSARVHPIKRTLNATELAEAAALKAIFKKKKKHSDATLTYETLSDDIGISAGAVGHYLNGVNALNAKIAAAFATALGIHVSDFSKRLAREISEMASTDKSVHSKDDMIPLITLAQAAEWVGTMQPYPSSWQKTVKSSTPAGERAYAVDVADNQLWSICPAGSQVVIDPDLPVKAMEYGAYLDPSTGATVIARYVTGFGQERLAFTDPSNFLPITSPVKCLGRLVAVLPRIL